MDVENNKCDTPKQQNAGEPGSDSAAGQSPPNRGAEVRGQAGPAASDVYDKTAQVMSKTYEQVKSYTRKNPDKAILVVLGIGVGLGFLLGASSRRTRTGRFAKPVVHALSDIALEFLR
ncbi:MAG: hypothetical protein EHM37_23720 [Deltaproteobacteria bacterium]|nr:MAG: hypothetical protein EHM37_23720 [Deltaproteobacteria bacterium]